MLPFLGLSQVKSIKLSINFEKIETDTKVDIASVRVLKNESEVNKEVLQTGKFKYKLDTGAIYKVYFSKINHMEKFLLIDTRMIPSIAKKNQKLRVTMTYFIGPEDADFSFLKSSPVGVARYDDQHKKLRWDYEYAFLINEKIGKILYRL